MGQRWYNVTSSRSSNVNYTNTTGKPIFVSINGRRDSTGTVSLILNVDGDEVARDDRHRGGINNLTAIIPPGSVYRVYGYGSYIDSWRELR